MTSALTLLAKTARHVLQIICMQLKKTSLIATAHLGLLIMSKHTSGQYQPVDTQQVNLDSLVMNLLENDPAVILSSPPETVAVRAYELIDFTAPADQVKSSTAQQIRNLNSDTNQAVRATAVHGFMARPMEQSSVMPSVSSSPLIPANAAA